jgi:hypothetical protein
MWDEDEGMWDDEDEDMWDDEEMKKRELKSSRALVLIVAMTRIAKMTENESKDASRLVGH